MKIGLVGDELIGWQGGQDFFRILFESLKVGCETEDEVTIATRICGDSLPTTAAQVAKHFLSSFPYNLRWIAHEMMRDSRITLIRRLTGEPARFATPRRKKSSEKGL